jgi:hypothetical protein
MQNESLVSSLYKRCKELPVRVKKNMEIRQMIKNVAAYPDPVQGVQLLWGLLSDLDPSVSDSGRELLEDGLIKCARDIPCKSNKVENILCLLRITSASSSKRTLKSKGLAALFEEIVKLPENLPFETLAEAAGRMRKDKDSESAIVEKYRDLTAALPEERRVAIYKNTESYMAERFPRLSSPLKTMVREELKKYPSPEEPKTRGGKARAKREFTRT